MLLRLGPKVCGRARGPADKRADGSRAVQETPGVPQGMITERSWQAAAASLEQHAGLETSTQSFKRTVRRNGHLVPYRMVEDQATAHNDVRLVHVQLPIRMASQHYRPRPQEYG